MKYLKTFEINNKLEIGDYVICEWYDGKYNNTYKEFNDFIKNKVGKLIDIDYKLIPGATYYIVEYDHIPDNLNNFKRYKNESAFTMKGADIVRYSKDKSELEISINTNKFNL